VRFAMTLTILFSTAVLAASTYREDSPKAKLFDGTGPHTRTVTTKSPEAQQYFNQGLNFLFAFNHDEAIRLFEQAAKLDPQCAMAHWGVAFANGPHINKPDLPPERAKAAWAACVKAKEAAASGTEAERGLIDALGKRYAETPPEERRPLDEAFADAMRKLWKQHGQDADIGALTAEAVMDLTPWDLWTADGQPRPLTPEILEIIETVMKLHPKHPLALHLYIHATEASPNPGRADEAANALRHLCPGLGHLVHMPSHIDIRRGRWQEAIEANQRAIAADAAYAAQRPQQGFYRLYMAHNFHMLAFAAVMQGESKRALDTMRMVLGSIPKEWLEKKENALIADGFFAVPIEILMRFGRWDDILKEPAPPEMLPIARALRHMARGVAYNAQGKTAEAREEQKLFREGVKLVGKDAQVGNNKAADVIAVADAMLEGEILVREGKLEDGLAKLRDAAAKEDKLKYDEPPDWFQPVRHALGAALVRAGQFVEAEKVYREDLARWPDNGWALFGLAQSLEKLGRDKEAAEVKAKFEKIWQRADVKLTASCFCQAEEKPAP
jgi:tetratricopeptide (TPR) repeat protein